MQPKAHFFVCTSCTYAGKNGQESSQEEAIRLRKALKERAKKRWPEGEVRVTAVKCLGECEHGIATVLYPMGQWRLNIRPDDEDKLFTFIAEQVDRLS